MVYLFFGFASEYVMNPLYLHMKQQGHECIELDMFTHPEPLQLLKSLKSKPVTFINSAHLIFDQQNFSDTYQFYGQVISPLEVLDFLKPVKSVCFSHDLGCTFVENEMPWLNLFDYLYIPIPTPLSLKFHPNAINVGWIKRCKAIPNLTKTKIGFALSEFGHYRRLGLEETYRIWEPILSQGVSIKLPYWEDSARFEDFFRSKGVDIFESAASISDFIDSHSTLLTNGLSSVNTEAAYSGRQVINLMDGLFTEQEHRKAMHHLPDIQFSSIENGAHHVLELLNGKQKEFFSTPQIKPFDFELATQILTSEI